MKVFWNKLKTKIYVLDLTLLFLTLVLVAPFFVLAFYNNPSIDDFSFVYLVKKMGFWGAQYNWYTTWTGRYSSMFILSVHPLWFKSLVLYKFISLGIIFFTIHAFYRLINLFFNTSSLILNTVIALAFSFTFFSGMPSLVQGIYWEPGSVTYQLANILLLHLSVNLIRLIISTSKKRSSLWLVINSFLIIIICGLNETSMLLTVVLLPFLMFVDFFLVKRINILLIKFEILAIICSLIVFLAPGNKGREDSFVFENSKDLFFTISSSFVSAWEYIISWIATPQIIITSILAIFLFLSLIEKKGEVINKIKWYYSVIALVLGYVFVAISLSPGFWALGAPAPSRTINVSYWLFSCSWIAFLFFLFQLISPILIKLKKEINYVLIFGFTLLLIFAKNDTYSTATNDVFSGSAAIYNLQFKERDSLMRTCENEVCSIPSFSVFPSSIFNQELSADDSDWWNHVYGLYYGKKAVHLVYRDPLNSASFFFNFENENNSMLQNLHTITDEVAFSLPNSSVILSEEAYGATFSVAIKDLPNKKTTDFVGLRISGQFYSETLLSKTMLVISIQDTTTEESVLWQSKNVFYKEKDLKKWIKTDFTIPLQKDILKPNNKVTIYLWNNGDVAKIFMDDFKIIFY
jgi:hypothetical protein